MGGIALTIFGIEMAKDGNKSGIRGNAIIGLMLSLVGVGLAFLHI